MTGDEICDFCIFIMEQWSKEIPLSYGEINVLLFIIFQPALIIYYFIRSIIIYFTTNKIKRIIIIINWLLFISLIIFTILLIGFPTMYIILESLN